MKKLLLMLLMFNSIVFATEYDEGIEYLKIAKPVKTINENNVEVKEVFLYTCPYCYQLEPLIKNWVAKKPDNVDFEFMPAVFSKKNEFGAIQFYTLVELNLVKDLHHALFDAIHKNNQRFNKDSFAAWVASLSDYSKEEVLKTMDSFAVRINVNKATINTFKYNIQGVPTMVVNGKYTTNATLASSQSQALKVVDYLVEEEAKELDQ